MSTPRVRMTAVVMALLDVIMSAPPDSPAWGLMLCELTGYGPSTVYPALDRLLKAGMIEDSWEEPAPCDRPRRRFYAITGIGRASYREEVTTRRAFRSGHARPALRAGGTA